VATHRQPALGSLPLGIKQKSILATCNYEARRRGVRKLMLISEAKKVCPDLAIVDGEDLSPFRDASKQLYNLLRSFSWNKRVERLGLDEVFMDVTDIVAFNIDLTAHHPDPVRAFFHLDARDPEQGFPFDATAVAGCSEGSPLPTTDNPLYLRLLLASHLARHLRLRIEQEGYTASCGVSTSKLLAKLAGNCNKPQNQTTLLGLDDASILAFMDSHGIRKVPGIGARTAHLVGSHVLGRNLQPDQYSTDHPVTVGQARTHADMSPILLERILAGPGAERGVGARVWRLLHGVDATEVKVASDIPAQISIEDTYQGLDRIPDVVNELRKLAASLLARMHVDLLADDVDGVAGPGRKRWLAYAKTLRLTTRPKYAAADGRPYNFNRISRSQPLPTFIFSSSVPPDQIVKRLVAESLVPMFCKLNPAKEGWNIGLLNVCVTNIVPIGSDDPAANGRDISAMLRIESATAETRITEPYSESCAPEAAPATPPSEDEDGWLEAESWHDRDSMEPCQACGHLIPIFAFSAHETFHALGD